MTLMPQVAAAEAVVWLMYKEVVPPELTPAKVAKVRGGGHLHDTHAPGCILRMAQFITVAAVR
jgi:hypothetical protein